MLGLGTQELIIILLVALLLFGGQKLPELSRGLGEAIRNIREGFESGTAKTSKKSKK